VRLCAETKQTTRDLSASIKSQFEPVCFTLSTMDDPKEKRCLRKNLIKMLVIFQLSEEHDTSTKWNQMVTCRFRQQTTDVVDEREILKMLRSLAESGEEDRLALIRAVLRLFGFWETAVDADGLEAWARDEGDELLLKCGSLKEVRVVMRLLLGETVTAEEYLMVSRRSGGDTWMLDAYCKGKTARDEEVLRKAVHASGKVTQEVLDFADKRDADVTIRFLKSIPEEGRDISVMRWAVERVPLVGIGDKWLLEACKETLEREEDPVKSTAILQRLVNARAKYQAKEEETVDLFESVEPTGATSPLPDLVSDSEDDSDSDMGTNEREEPMDVEVIDVDDVNDVDEVTEGQVTEGPVPIERSEVCRILRDRYRCRTTGEKGVELKEGRDGYKDAAWQAKNWWVTYEQRIPTLRQLWRIKEAVQYVMTTPSKAEGAWNPNSAKNYLTNMSLLLNHLEDGEIERYFGTREHFEECRAIILKSMYEIKEIVSGLREDQEYTEADRNVPPWEELRSMAEAYVRTHAAPLKITNDNHVRLVRRLYGLRISVIDHVPRRRDVFKLALRRLVRDLMKENYVEGTVLRLHSYKTAVVYGEYSIHLNEELAKLVRLLEEWAEEKGKETLFGSEHGLTSVLHDIYEPVFGCKVGCGVLRRKYVSYAKRTGQLDWIRQQTELSRMMGQSVWMQSNYYAKHEEEGVGQKKRIAEDSGAGAGAGPVKKLRTQATPAQKAAIRDIIEKEQALQALYQKNGKRIRWKQYIPKYEVLKDVEYNTVKEWGKNERARMGSRGREDA
jgi:hypothetical protein